MELVLLAFRYPLDKWRKRFFFLEKSAGTKMVSACAGRSSTPFGAVYCDNNIYLKREYGQEDCSSSNDLLERLVGEKMQQRRIGPRRITLRNDVVEWLAVH